MAANFEAMFVSSSRHPKPPGAHSRLKQFFAALGPGLITGAADDDPSGIATYTSAGALLGISILWTALITWPLMAAVQFMCARIGLTTGQGLTVNLKRKFPPWVAGVLAMALLAANSINIGADLSGMADAASYLTHCPSMVLVFVFGIGITWATVAMPYYQLAGVLKWLALSLFAYVVAAFVSGGNFAGVLRATLTPSLPHGKDAWGMLVAILGTTISPYLFYWQASEETEEERAAGRISRVRRSGTTDGQIITRKIDVGIGTFFSNLVMYFIILTAAITLHRTGSTQIETSRQAADALRPIAGQFSALLYTAGIVGVGLLAIPTLSGSAAYALAETFNWRQGLAKPLGRAPAFYGVIIVATLVGIALNFARVNPVKALYWSAVINGLLAPFLMVAILLVAMDSKLMNNQPSSILGRVTVAIATLFMFAAAVGMFVFQ
ncbi:MAG TPA: divalent metal cation transporter [Chthoniobacteraceae bacterium]|jgi:Mn2+/Fe2+ NRAMP family transporter|nr:divalent metal cation transporter [Chthoniobacteraceae bacterium]